MEKRKLIRELQSHQSVLKEKAREKARESISAVIPIVLIVFILGFYRGLRYLQASWWNSW